MSTFGQIVNGAVRNICYGADLQSALATSFAPGFVVSETTAQPPRPWVQVPDGTANGSWTQDGINFTPPMAVTSAPVAPCPGVEDCYAALVAIAGKVGVALPTITGK